MKGVSKLRNVYGEPQKEKFTDVSLNEATTEGNLLAVNGSFLAISWQGVGGCVGVFDANKPSRISPEIPLIRGHSSYVADVKFSPFRANLLSTGSDDTTVKLWEIPQDGLTEDITVELQKYTGHTRKVSLVEFNPVVNEVIASASFDNSIHVWDITKAEAISKVTAGDNPTALQWNYNGSLLGASTKEKLAYIIDPRTGTVTIKAKAHESSKVQKMTFVDENHFVTVGFGKSSMREIKLFDMRQAEGEALDKFIGRIDVDRQSGIMTPFYDRDLKLLYVPGRGEGNIHYFDLADLQIKECSEYKSSQPQKAICPFEKKTMNYNKCEIARYAKVTGTTLEYLSFYVPRRNPGYDASLYPPTYAGEPSTTFDEWKEGQNKPPVEKVITEIKSTWVTEPIKFEKKVEEVKLTVDEENTILKKKVEALDAQVSTLTVENERLKKELETIKNKYDELKKENDAMKSNGAEAAPEEPTE